MNNEQKIAEIEAHIKAISDILGIEETESNKDTPRRVAKMYVNELFRNLNHNNAISDLVSKMTLFENEGTTTPITVKGISFSSVCEHHWLPFMGEVSVTYIPDKKIIGLSKIPRVVKYYSKMPQLQERLTKDIGEYLYNLLKPKYLKVEIVSTHTCVMCRGAESDCETVTSYVRGEYHG